MTLIYASNPVNGVFHAKVTVGSYALNFYEAERLCGLLGATLASYDQLYRAWQAGFGICR